MSGVGRGGGGMSAASRRPARPVREALRKSSRPPRSPYLPPPPWECFLEKWALSGKGLLPGGLDSSLSPPPPFCPNGLGLLAADRSILAGKSPCSDSNQELRKGRAEAVLKISLGQLEHYATAHFGWQLKSLPVLWREARSAKDLIHGRCTNSTSSYYSSRRNAAYFAMDMHSYRIPRYCHGTFLATSS